MTFIDRLLSIMKEKNISAYRLSKDLGLSNSLMSKWQKSPNIDPSASTAYRISEYFHINVEWLISGNGEKYKDTYPNISQTDLPTEEKILLENYRDSTEDKKIKLQKEAAKMALQGKYSESSNLKNSKSDVEFSDGVG